MMHNIKKRKEKFNGILEDDTNRHNDVFLPITDESKKIKFMWVGEYCFFCPLKNLSLIQRSHHYRWRGGNYAGRDLYRAISAVIVVSDLISFMALGPERHSACLYQFVPHKVSAVLCKASLNHAKFRNGVKLLYVCYFKTSFGLLHIYAIIKRGIKYRLCIL